MRPTLALALAVSLCTLEVAQATKLGTGAARGSSNKISGKVSSQSSTSLSAPACNLTTCTPSPPICGISPGVDTCGNACPIVSTPAPPASSVNTTQCNDGRINTTTCGVTVRDNCSNSCGTTGTAYDATQCNRAAFVCGATVTVCGTSCGTTGTAFNSGQCNRAAVACGDPVNDACGNSCGTTGTGLKSSQCNAAATPCGQTVRDSCGNDCGTVGTANCCDNTCTDASTRVCGSSYTNGCGNVCPIGTGLNSGQCNPAGFSCGQPVKDSCNNDCGMAGTSGCCDSSCPAQSTQACGVAITSGCGGSCPSGNALNRSQCDAGNTSCGQIVRDACNNDCGTVGTQGCPPPPPVCPTITSDSSGLYASKAACEGDYNHGSGGHAGPCYDATSGGYPGCWIGGPCVDRGSFQVYNAWFGYPTQWQCEATAKETCEGRRQCRNSICEYCWVPPAGF